MKVWRGSERYRDLEEDRITHHSFSFGHHYSPDNLAFGPLRAFDDHALGAGAGFEEHRHSEVELVTWVQSGVLVHTGEDGVSSELPAGTVQVQSAGSGIRHCERAAAGHSTRFIQSWLVPGDDDGPPMRRVSTVDREAPLHRIAGAGTELPVRSPGAALWYGTLTPGSSTRLPPASALHLFVVEGTLELHTATASPEQASPAQTSPEQTPPVLLGPGDALRATAEQAATSAVAHRLVTTPSTRAQILLWTFGDAPHTA